MKREVAIIHFNTPELTEATILSIRKHGGRGYHVTIFDNSDSRPFDRQMPGVTVIDNTKGQIINFDKKLAKFKNRDRSIGCAKGCEFGSVKHMMTVQKLWDLLPEGFLLMDSDILLKRDVEEFFRPEYSFVGYYQQQQPHNPFRIGRVLPFLCYMNVPLLKKYKAKYYDPTRTYGLLAGGRANRNNWYDTGAVMLEDIMQNRPNLKGMHIDIRLFMEHYGSGSWMKNSIKDHEAWLEQNSRLWKANTPRVAVCAIGRRENLYAVEWIEHYKQLGVSKVILYENNRPDDGETFADVLQPYIDEGLVEIIPWKGFQNPAYTDCYQRYGKTYDWIGFLDFDEYVMFDDPEATLPAFLKECCGDCLQLNWRIMTDSGLVHYDSRPLQKRFTEARELDFSIHHHVKSFVRGGQEGVIFLDPHSPAEPKMMCVNAEGRQVEQKSLVSTVTHHPARIDHFNTKTAEEWVSIKMKRLFPIDGDYNANAIRDNVEYFFSINKRTPEKEAILCGRTDDEIATNGDPSVVGKPKTKKRAKVKKRES